ncbi:MAG TPA: hypothetical protein VG368_05965 [Acidimicrobiales bacterium]|nr:hypothetical protein [Acidimicrobiales bacterium]
MISCDECALDRTTACADCVVSFVLDHEPGDAIIIDAAEERAVRLLAGGGLIPGLRHTRRAG